MGGSGIGKGEVQCPHCGHFIGPATRCAHCGMRLEKPMKLKVLRIAAGGVAVVGLLLLHLYARNHELPVVQIGSISPVMNFASVRVQGQLESDARPLRSGSVLYMVNDGTGSLAVFAERPEGKLPKAGSRIMVEGSLSIGVGHELRMRAYSADCVSVEDVPADEVFLSPLKLADISADQKGDPITVAGKVSNVWKPPASSKAPYKIILEDHSGTLEVVHWISPPPQIAAGDLLEVSGVVEVYKGKIQLKVAEAEGFQPLEAPPKRIEGAVSIGAITSSMEGKWLSVEGELGPPRSIPGGVVYPLKNRTGSIPVVLWDRNLSGEERDALDEGVRVRVHAPVGLYKGNPQLVPEDVGGVRLLE